MTRIFFLDLTKDTNVIPSRRSGTGLITLVIYWEFRYTLTV